MTSEKVKQSEGVGVSKDDERVLVTPSRVFRAAGSFQGFSADALEEASAIFHSSELRFMRRGDAERDPEFKQLIPYVVFTHTTPVGDVFVFAYRRGCGQGEARLHSKWSVGVGGHINDSDASATGEGLFDAGARREMEEEVTLAANVRSFRKVGLVNDDETEVGRVHLGVVCRAELDAPSASPNEPDILEARFRPVTELLREMRADPSRFESWSTLTIEGLFGESVPRE